MTTAAASRSIPKGIYAITDGPRPDLLDAVDAALHGGIAILQYRDKTSDHARRLSEAQALRQRCRDQGVVFLINDDVELAAAVAADGVHLGEDDGAIATARERLGSSAIIGVSCYDSLPLAQDKAALGADYLAFGAFYPTRSKQTTRRASPSLLCEARALELPLVAIGGITADNALPLIHAGADCIAVISALFGADNIEGAARRLRALYAAPP